MAYSTYPRGSEWRKWDLHLHSPMSGLANAFPKLNGGPDWEKYIATLESLTDIPAVGVTDYFLIEGYKELTRFKSAGHLSNIHLLLPNIEFRLDNIVGGKRLNFHVIFSDQVSVSDIEDHFLSNIDIVIQGSACSQSDIRKLRRSSLEELGARLKGQHQNFKGSDFEIGCMNAVVKLDQLRELLTQNSRFKDHYLTALAEEQTSLMDWNGQDHNVRKVLLQSSQILLSANPNSIAWCLGKKHSDPKDFVREFNGFKPCIIGSDAHALDRIGQPTNGKYTWIKADVSFDGLRQIIYEPENRVFIGSTPPDEKDNTKVIASITIANANGWFNDQTININPDLVAIIGGKGSGKTALLDLVAYAAGDFEFKNKEAFINKAEEEVSGAELTLQWADGSPASVCKLHDPSSYPNEAKVRYLSQSFVENLCSFDQHEKLVHQIENILFQYVPPDKRMAATDFGDLKDIKTRSVQLEIEDIAANLKSLNGDIFKIESDLDAKPELIKEQERLTKEKADLESQRPAAANQEEQQEQQQLQALREKKAGIEKTIETHRLTIAELEEFQTRSKLLKGQIEEFNAETTSKLKNWELENSAADLGFGIPLRLEDIIKKRIAEIEATIGSLVGRQSPSLTAGPRNDAPETLGSVEKAIADIEAKSNLEAQRKRKLIEFGKRIAEITARISTVAETIVALDTTKKQLLDEKIRERDDTYLEFFKKLEEKKKSLEELYKPLNEPVGASGERGKVQFYARFNFNTRRFVTEGINLFDGRKFVIRGESGLADVADEYWKQVQKLLPNMNKVPMTELLSTLQESPGGPRDIRTQLRSEFDRSDVYDWLYCIDYFDVEYGIKYENVELDKLSPGRKGVVLLLIYLDVDQDFRPLLIDQPEENLDNRSVYSTLVEYFMKAKKRRQIILVTHNANLVVNADAEQVIVANFDLDRLNQSAKIEYVSGALEFRKNPVNSMSSQLLRQGIREHVCEILEGGDEAFQRREHKYGFTR